MFVAAERLARARSFEQIVEVVRSAAREIIGADGITLVRCEGDECHYIAEDAIAPLWEGQKFKLSECVSGWVMQNGKPAVIPDIYTDERVPQAAYRPTFVKSMAMMPVQAGASRASIGAYWARANAPDQPALDQLQRLADFVSAAMDNVALQNGFQLLNRTGAAVAAERDLDRIVQLITDAGVELTGAEFGAFFYNLVNEKGESYMLYSLSGVPREAFSKFPMPRNTAVFAPTFSGEGVVRSDNIRLDPRYGHNTPRKGMPEGHLPVTSYLAVPVVSRTGEVHGGLFFGHHREAQFTPEHETAVLGIAGHAATAIDNARLYQSLERELIARRAAEAALTDLNATLEKRIEERTQEIRAAYDKLKESDRRFRILVNGVTDYAIYMLDTEGQVTNWNAGAERIKGYAADEIIGRHFSTFYTERDREAGKPAQTLDTATRTGKFEAEGWRVRKDGTEFWASVVVDAIQDEEGKLIGFAKITRDLTEKRFVDEQLRQSQKMEAVGHLTGGIAHDFNNLLTIITGNMDIAARALDKNEGIARAQKAIGNAMKGAERAGALTQRLLAFARRQPLSPKPLDLDKVVAGMSDLLNRSLGELVKLEIVTSPGLWPVEADPNQMENALLNLAVNSRDAMPNGGTLTIETANAHLDTAYSAAHAEVPAGNYVVVAVSDTGLGMPKEHLVRVFEPFFTTKEVGRGTGLGLSQVYGFVKQSGGHVNVYSEEGRGTTVKMYLPRFTGELNAVTDVELGRLDGPGAAGETILVVEDDDEVRAFSAEVLRELGYTVLEAADGTAALRILEQPGVEVDLLFTDVVMPGMSGRELSDEARKLRPALKVLFTSGYTRNAIVHGGRLDPGVELIPKPFTSRALAERVRELLDAGKCRRLLVVEADQTLRLLAAEAFAAAGYHAELAGTAGEALGVLRAAQGRFDGIVIDGELPDKDGFTLLSEIRRLFADLPAVITVSAGDSRAINDPRAVRIEQPFSATMIINALTSFERQG
ncbi:hypothetical protein M529_20160 [Sphingobium ummariense RL-3]|uniref:histidine kinase n=1 Tax=Sphingobium ummariense RL-3 TaxID=1346791 RepID=T0K1E6_9SPHN|nr:hypothetical protein M529_20160 [Sphingobium ummariense RL-3]